MHDETAKLDISKLDEILKSTNVNYKKIRCREAFNEVLFEVYFHNDDDMFKGINTLNLKKNSNLFCRITDIRINEKNKMVYVVPFKKKTDTLR